MGRSQGDKPVNYDYYRTNFMKLMDNLDWPYTIHATRHTFTSLLADLGVSPTIRSKLAGHSQRNVTETVYTHLDVNILLDAVVFHRVIPCHYWTKKEMLSCAMHLMHFINLLQVCCKYVANKSNSSVFL